MGSEPKKPETNGPARRRSGLSRRSFLKWSGATGAATTALMAAAPGLAQANPINTENAQSGTIPDTWASWRNTSIQGFATKASVLPGESIDFKIDTASTDYRVHIYRLGWYGGAGARFITELTPTPRSQPLPAEDPDTGLVDCGNWLVSASWTVPAGSVSGVYYAHFVRRDNNEDNYTTFVVRRNGPADILVQTSDMTTQAYNRYGGNSLYYGDPTGRAYKVSYNRPDDLGPGHENEFFSTEYALVRFLERNGYDVAYCAGLDVHQNASVLTGKKIFISSGHDEYVSGPQRTNVEAALAGGMHMIFMTGNEYFWKVRFEPSIAGPSTPDRTMVCYKETLDHAKIDPSPEWTGTWRDPRFSPPSNGGHPENALTGQLFRAILPTSAPDLAITVPADFSALRFWRNTAVAALGPGQTRTLASDTLGYEFDVDEYDAHRPPGSIRLSATTATVPDFLVDYGGQYVSATCEHNMTMYRAPSGALVWGTGTVQWSYGLDENHGTDRGSPTDPVIQQATVNALADMGAQPTTLMTGLVAASAGSPGTPPAVAVTSPATGSSAPIGSSVVISGTAVASPGAVVAAVEVSVENGPWQPTTGRAAWSYVYTPLTIGPHSVRIRAIDDRCQPGPAATVAINGVARSLPCSIFPESATPAHQAIADAGPIEVGVRFRSELDGYVTKIRFFKGAGNGGTHVGRLWTTDGVELTSGTFTNETPGGWQSVDIAPVPISAGTVYVASVFLPQGHYSADTAYFASAFDLPPLRALADGEAGANGVFRAGSAGFPTSTYGAANYWVDVVVASDDGRAPTVVDRSPAPDLQAVAPSSTVRATFSEQVVAGSVAVALATEAGADVAGTVSYEASSRTAQFTPAAPLATDTNYTVTVSGAVDLVGTTMTAQTWSFSTVSTSGTGPVTLWDTSNGPATLTGSDLNAVEVGVKFRTDIEGTVTALRYFRSTNSSGAAVGHLWTADGTLLATRVFDQVQRSGWQQAALDTPVPVSPGVTYIVSYHVPSGGYVATGGSLSVARDRAPLHAPAAGEVDGNGVYRYGASAFPSSASNGSNYWADVVFLPAPDTTAPTLSDHAPASGLNSVATGSTVTATFNEAVNPGTLVFGLTVGGSPVAGTVSYDAATRTATLTPAAALPGATEVTASVQASDTSGNAMAAPVTWGFTTAGTGAPQTLWDTAAVPSVPANNDTDAIEVGTRFTVSKPGMATAIRFYKGPGNTGQHVGHLWKGDGTLLGSAVFTSESATGWQQATLQTPVPLTTGQVYVVSYFAPVGRYAGSNGYFNSARTSGALTAPASSGSGGNGLFRYGGGFTNGSYQATNYWVDLVFSPDEIPTVTGTTPAGGTVDVGTNTTVAATFSQEMAPGSIVLTLRDGNGIAVAGTVAYDADSQTATLTPSAALAAGATFTASVESAQSSTGIAMSGSATWSFTTRAAVASVSLWAESAVPAALVADDASAVNLGVRVQTSAAGQVVGVRFYKGGTSNSGPHSVHLWSSTGTLLATATIGTETPRGWQTGYFSAPVSVAAGEYVASYHAPAGGYSIDAGFFNGTTVTNGPLTAPATTGGAGNGLYAYGASGLFPNSSYNGGNYWIDLLFVEAGA